MSITLKGKRAVKVKAERVTWGSTPKAKLYKIDGEDEPIWIPNSQCEFTVSPTNDKHVGNTDGTIVIAEWFYKKLFPNG